MAIFWVVPIMSLSLRQYFSHGTLFWAVLSAVRGKSGGGAAFAAKCLAFYAATR